MENSLEVILERTRLFRQARFGMFIHFGLYAIPGRGEWIRSNEKMTIEDYQPYFEALSYRIQCKGVGKSCKRGRDEICCVNRKTS